jgi:hypothetical protein
MKSSPVITTKNEPTRNRVQLEVISTLMNDQVAFSVQTHAQLEKVYFVLHLNKYYLKQIHIGQEVSTTNLVYQNNNNVVLILCFCETFRLNHLFRDGMQ